MPSNSNKKMCLYQFPGTERYCGAISTQTYCSTHRTNSARGYGTEHQKSRKAAMAAAPYCWKCGRKGVPLEWHHVEPRRGGRSLTMNERRQLLCRICHKKEKES